MSRDGIGATCLCSGLLSLLSGYVLMFHRSPWFGPALVFLGFSLVLAGMIAIDRGEWGGA